MGTLVEKLDYLEQTKKDIQQAIIAKGVEVGNDVTFRDYATKVSAISGGGGGETVYAVNNTGAAVVKGTKAWLNRHNLDENEAYQLFDQNNGINVPLVDFDGDNNVLFCFAGYRTKYVYDAEAKTWAASTLTAGESTAAFMRKEGGIMIGYTKGYLSSNAERSIIITETADFPLQGWYLGQGLMITYAASGQYELKKVDTSTWAAGDTVYTFTSGTGALFAAFLAGNTLFYAADGGEYFFYDITGWDNEFFEITLQLLGSGTLATFASNYPAMFATGLGIGDYFILNQGATPNTNQGSNLIILKIGADYAVQEADDLPADLAGLVGLPARVQYYNDTGYLTVGTVDNVYLFKFEGGAFVNQSLTLTLPTDYTKPEAYCWKLYISNDLTSAALVANTSSSKQKLSLYKLATSSGDWYADTFGMASSLSLTGFATGATDEAGRYEFKTVTA